MFTKQDFQAAIANNITNYQVAAAYYQAGDPRLLAQLDAIATMLAMLSQQVEVAGLEPFIKSRDATVLADAALKGVLPFATPAKAVVMAQNPTERAYLIAAGRVILDSAGRPWVVEQPVSVPAGGSAGVAVIQRTERTYQHSISEARPFYSIQVVEPPEDQFMVEVSLTRSLDSVQFKYSPDFVNVGPGDLAFNLETDEYRRTFIKFGYETT